MPNEDDEIREIDLGGGPNCEFCASQPCICDGEDDEEENPELTLTEAQKTLSPLGITIKHVRDTGEYRVNFKGGGENTAYYTDDLKDALSTGEKMASAKAGMVDSRYDTEAMENSDEDDEPSTWQELKKEMSDVIYKAIETDLKAYDVDPDEEKFAIEAAIRWFANDYHEGQKDLMYSVLSQSKYEPSPMVTSIDDEGEIANAAYDALADEYAEDEDEDEDEGEEG